MTKKNININIKKHQGGYSIIELIVVLGIVAVLASGVLMYANSISENNTIKTAKNELLYIFPNAIRECIARRNTLTGCNTAKIKEVLFLNTANTAWGEVWTATDASDKVTIVYPISNSQNPDSVGNDLITLLNARPKITASYNSSIKKLTVVYSK